MRDLRMGMFHQMEETIRGHLAEASRRASRGDRFEGQKQAMINLGVPEAVAEDRAKALTLFAEGDADYVADDVPSILGRPAASNRPAGSFEQFATDCAAAFSDAQARSRPRPGLPT